MRYRGALTIPAGTTQAAPAVAVVELCYGEMLALQILFPAGQAGLTYLQIWYHEHQIFPTSPGEAFRGDDSIITFPERYPVKENPLAVELRGWAPDTELDHTVYVDFTVENASLPVVPGFAFVPLPEGI